MPVTTTIETFQLAVPTTKLVRTTLDAEVEKQTIAVEVIQAMNETELHATHSRAIVGAVSSFVNRVRLVTEIYKRFQAGKTVGGCTNFKAYLVLYRAQGESAENAVRRAYYALNFEEKRTGEKIIPNKQNAGRKPAAECRQIFTPSESSESVPSDETITVKPTSVVYRTEFGATCRNETVPAITPTETVESPASVPDVVTDKNLSHLKPLREWFATRYSDHAFMLRPAERDIHNIKGRMGNFDLVLLHLSPKQVKAIGELLAASGVKA